MINKEATDRLELIFAIADNDEPKQAEGEDEATFPKIMRLATEALEILKEQPPASDFTKGIRSKLVDVALLVGGTDNMAETYRDMNDLCDRLDVSVAELKSSRVKYDVYKAYAEDKVKNQSQRIKDLEASRERKDEYWIEREEQLEASRKELKELLTEYGRHSPGCSREFGKKYRCRCGWSKVEANK